MEWATAPKVTPFALELNMTTHNFSNRNTIANFVNSFTRDKPATALTKIVVVRFTVQEKPK